MANYKINRNKPEPTEEQINKSKDFQQLINNHQQITQYKKATKPLYKNPGFMSFIIVVSVALLTFFITENESASKQEKKDTKTIIKKDSSTETTTEINSETSNPTMDTVPEKELPNKISEEKSIPDTKPDYKQSINITEGGIIYFGSTRVLVPPFAFIDAKGNPVKENVEIIFKEFRDPASIAFANIPMHYDSTKEQMQLVSAGMFDIRGYANNQPVQIAKPLQVEMATSQHTNYNLYYLNQTNNQWEFISKENKSYRFNVTGNESAFPELLPFKAVEWEFKPANSKQLADFNLLFSKEWNQFILEDELKPDLSTMVKFKRLSSEQNLIVTPVKLSANPELNKQLIQAKYNLYKEVLKKKLRDGERFREAMQKQKAWLESFEGKKYVEWMNSPEGQQQRLAMKVVSVFSINKFGIWNCDTPINLPKEATVNATFKDEKGKILDLAKVQLVDYSKNTVYTYFKGRPVQFNPKVENILWASLPGGKLAIVTKENFKSIPTKGNVTIVMNVIDINGKTEEEVKELLAMKNHSTSKEKEKEKNAVANYERLIVLKPLYDKREVFYTGEDTDINSNGRVNKAAEETAKPEQERILKEADAAQNKAIEDAKKKARRR